METIKNIHTRRSIRNYSDQPVSKEELQEILEAGTWAPSGVNSHGISLLCTAQKNEQKWKKSWFVYPIAWNRL